MLLKLRLQRVFGGGFFVEQGIQYYNKIAKAVLDLSYDKSKNHVKAPLLMQA